MTSPKNPKKAREAQPPQPSPILASGDSFLLGSGGGPGTCGGRDKGAPSQVKGRAERAPITVPHGAAHQHHSEAGVSARPE
ncbi:hypothetical protein GCM10009603_27530 [Nocardiopsis exhalans]